MSRAKSNRLEVHPEHPEAHRIGRAVAELEKGLAIVYPTDSLYGLAVDLRNLTAIDRLYRLRRLDPKKPLSLICSSLSQIGQYAVVSNECFRFMRRVLPGPFTFVLNATREVPKTGQSKRKTVGIRFPDHPVAQALVEQLGRPLLSTSAVMEEDPEGLSDPLILAGAYPAREVPLVLDAGLLEGTPSTVVDWTGEAPDVLRIGAGDITDLGA